jgi:hypothetical protein
MRTTKRTARRTRGCRDDLIIADGAAFKYDQVEFVATTQLHEPTGLGSDQDDESHSGVVVLNVQDGPVCIRIASRTAQAIIDAFKDRQAKLKKIFQ